MTVDALAIGQSRRRLHGDPVEMAAAQHLAGLLATNGQEALRCGSSQHGPSSYGAGSGNRNFITLLDITVVLES